MVERVEDLADNNGFNYRDFSDRYKWHVKLYGFKCLNSIYCINHNDEIYDAI